MSIGDIRPTLLRRAALVAYVLPFVVSMLVLGLLKWGHDVMLTTVDGIHATLPEIQGCAKLIRDVWRGK